MQKNVDYAAYEYNVYVRCDYHARKKIAQDSKKKKVGGDSPIG